MNTESSNPQEQRSTESGGTPASVVTQYDFSHPQHRLSEMSPGLALTGKKIASTIADALESELHIECTVALSDNRCVQKDALISGLEVDTCVYRHAVHDLAQDVLLFITPQLIQSLVGIYFGGTSRNHLAGSSRTLSGTEYRLADRLRKSIVNAVQFNCDRFFSLDTTSFSLLTAEELNVHSLEESIVAELAFSISINDQQSEFTVVFPWLAAQKVKQLNSRAEKDDAGQAKWQTALAEHVADCTIDLQGKLAETEVTVAQLLDMKTDDFIPLADVGTATFTVDGTPLFEASIGSNNGVVSASILQWMNGRDARDE